MSSVQRPLTLVAIIVAACLSLSPSMSAISPEAAEVQLQMAQLLFSDGRYGEAFDAFEALKAADDPQHPPRSADGLRADRASARRFLARVRRRPDADAQRRDATPTSSPFTATRSGPSATSKNPRNSISDALALVPGHPRGAARHGAEPGRPQQADGGAGHGAGGADRVAARRGDSPHRGVDLRARCTATKKPPTRSRATSICCRNKDRSAKAAWARAEVRFLRAFGNKVPLQIDPASAGKLHTVPFRVIERKGHRPGQGEQGTDDGLRAGHRRGADRDLPGDAVASRHSLHREHPERRRGRPRRPRAGADAAGRPGNRHAEGAQRAVDHQESAAAAACRRARWKASRRWRSGCRW